MGVVGLVVAASLALTYMPVTSHAPSTVPGIHEPPGTLARSPSRVLSQAPYMGVLCPEPNSIACDQVGLAIVLKRPAMSVIASINGRMLAMNRRGDQLTSTRKPRLEFDGYLKPAGIVSSLHVRPLPGKIWLGDPTPFETVWLLVDYRGGRYVVTHLRVPLSAGWG